MLFLVVSLLFLPIYLVINWVLAAAVHELSHIIMLSFLKIRIFQIKMTATGTYIETDTMTPKQEVFCALAGPLGGLLGLLFYWINPYFAICSFLQSIFNLLPLYPADGGRALNGLLCLMFGEQTANRISNWVGIAVLISVIIGGYKLLIRNVYPLEGMHIVGCILAVILLKNSLQRCRKDSTM